VHPVIDQVVTWPPPTSRQLLHSSRQIEFALGAFVCQSARQVRGPG